MPKDLLTYLRSHETNLPLDSVHARQLKNDLQRRLQKPWRLQLISLFAFGSVAIILLLVVIPNTTEHNPTALAAERMRALAASHLTPPEGMMLHVVKTSQIVPYDGSTHEPSMEFAFTVHEELWTDGRSIAGIRKDSDAPEGQLDRKFLMRMREDGDSYLISHWVVASTYCEIPADCWEEQIVEYPTTTTTWHQADMEHVAEAQGLDLKDKGDAMLAAAMVQCDSERDFVFDGEPDPLKDMLGWYHFLPRALDAIDGEICLDTTCEPGKNSRPLFSSAELIASDIPDASAKIVLHQMRTPDSRWDTRTNTIWIDADGFPVRYETQQDDVTIERVDYAVSFERAEEYIDILSPEGWRIWAGIDAAVPYYTNRKPPYSPETRQDELDQIAVACPASD